MFLIICLQDIEAEYLYTVEGGEENLAAWHIAFFLSCLSWLKGQQCCPLHLCVKCVFSGTYSRYPKWLYTHQLVPSSLKFYRK